MSKNQSLQLKLTIPPSVIVYRMEEIKAGALVTESKLTGSDKGVVYQTGSEVLDLKKGDKIVVPAWVPEKFTHNDESYYYFESKSFPWLKYE